MRLVVVGAGVVGSACAYTAAGLGAEVIVADAALPGRATAAGAGIICPWTARGDDPAWYSFGCAAARRYPDLISELAESGAGDASYRRVGALLLADDGQLAQSRELMATRRESAPEIGDLEVIDAAQARGLFPPLRGDQPALYIGGAARVDGRELSQALLDGAVRRGAELRSGHAELAFTAGRVNGVVIGAELIEADAVVAAAGAWTGSFVQPAGVTVRVSPERGQIGHFLLDGVDTSGWPVVLPSGSGHYLLAFSDSRVVAGATREPDAGLDARITAGGMREVLSEALAVAPGLAAATMAETRVGLRPASFDGRPLLGSVPGAGGLVVATGLGASGLTLGPLAGEIAARVALGLDPGPDPGVDLKPFDPVR